MRYLLSFVFLMFFFASCSPMSSKQIKYDLSSPLVVSDRAGNVHDISSLLDSGKVVLLVFWQPWCSSCKAEAPEVQKLLRRYNGKLSVFGVLSGPGDTVDASGVERFMKLTGATYPNVRDTNVEITKRFHVRGVPTIILIKGNQVLYHGSHVPDVTPYL